MHLANPPIPTKCYKDPEDGFVIIGPRNFTTMRTKMGKVGKSCTFGGQIPYREDDYNRKKMFYKAELHYHNSMV